MRAVSHSATSTVAMGNKASNDEPNVDAPHEREAPGLTGLCCNGRDYEKEAAGASGRTGRIANMLEEYDASKEATIAHRFPNARPPSRSPTSSSRKGPPMNSTSFREAFPDAFQRYESTRQLGRPKTKTPGGARTSSSSGRSPSGNRQSAAAAAASPSKQRTSGDKQNVQGRVRTAEEVAAFGEGGEQGDGSSLTSQLSGLRVKSKKAVRRRSVSNLRIETEEEDTH